MNLPLARNIFLSPGADYSESFSLGWMDANGNPLDLSTYTGTGSFREWYGSNTAVAFTVTPQSNSTVTLALAATALANTTPGHFVFDVFVTAANVTSKALDGSVIVDPTITFGGP